ncbi:MAG: amidohydrolase family protein [Chromatiales bacterium]|jgi:L-fuconolactonase|nr:amidohydrolase family protein [Chromatiales bacterium]
MFDRKWLALTTEETLEPELPICDPHHHLWDQRVVEHWRDQRYLLDELLTDTGSGHNIKATVYIECRSMFSADGPEIMRPIGETEFVNGVAAMSASGLYGPTRACAGIVGFADLMLGESVAPVLQAHLKAGGGRFRGIRHSTAFHDDDLIPTSLSNPPKNMFGLEQFRRGFAQLKKHDLSFEAWLYHPQLPELIDLARAFPDTTIILNHFGGPLGVGPYAGKRDEVFQQWSKDIHALAAHPNVVAKLGGLQMFVNGFGWHDKATPPGSEMLCSATRPYHDYVIEQFGVERCMFESNFPVDNLSCSYNVLWNSFKRIASGCSAAEKASLFHDTAMRVYRLAL